MIRFFTNYSYGGYEELYLGSNLDKEEYRYYLPLLANKKARLAENPNNEKLATEVERLSKCVLIQKNGETQEGTLPKESFTIISNQGYRTICRRTGSLYIVAIGDVVGSDHDEMGSSRGIPFTMLFILDSEDKDLLDALLWKLVHKEEYMRNLLGNLFVYDPVVNGLRFSLAKLVSELKSLESLHVTGIDHSADIPLIVLEKDFTLAYAMEVQKIEGLKVGAAYSPDGTLIKGNHVEANFSRGNNQKEFVLTDEDKQQVKVQKTDDAIVDGHDNNISQENLRKEIEAELRSVLREDVRKEIYDEIKNELDAQYRNKEISYIKERKILLYVAAGVAIGAFVLGAVIFK